jgi:magnesium transporter
VIRGIGERYGMHVLELEDIVHIPQRPKAEVQGKHLFLVTRMPLRKGEDLEIEQVSLFVGENYVLTFQEKAVDVLAPNRERLRQGVGPKRRMGPGYLAYALHDAIVDANFPHVEEIGTELEDLEGEVVDVQQPWMLGDLNRIRAELLRFRRILTPQRDALSTMLKDQNPYMGQDVQIYLRDTYDHLVQLLDVVESQREIGSGILNTYLTLVANRTNDVMKVLTIMASIFIPLTFMAGIYGMNFAHMPELALEWGYPALLVAMAIVGVGMLVFFRRRGWLGGAG